MVSSLHDGLFFSSWAVNVRYNLVMVLLVLDRLVLMRE